MLRRRPSLRRASHSLRNSARLDPRGTSSSDVKESSPPAYYVRYHDIRLHVAPSKPHVYAGDVVSCAVYLNFSAEEPFPEILHASVCLHPEVSRRKRNYVYDTTHETATAQALGNGVALEYEVGAMPSRAQILPTPVYGPRNARYIYSTAPLMPPIPGKQVYSCGVNEYADITGAVQRAMRFNMALPANVPESVSFMEDMKPDCRIDVRLRIRAELKLLVRRAADGALTSEPRSPQVLVLVAENVAKVLPTCTPPGMYDFAPSADAGIDARGVLAGIAPTGDDTQTGVAAAAPERRRASTNALERRATARASATGSVLSDASLYTGSAATGCVEMSSAAFLHPLRVGEETEVHVRVSFPGAPRRVVTVQTSLQQYVCFASVRHRCRRSLSSVDQVTLDERGAATLTVAFLPSRYDAFYPSTVAGPLAVYHVMSSAVHGFTFSRKVRGARMVRLLPGRPSQAVYGAQNVDSFPRWCLPAHRRVHRPVATLVPVEVAPECEDTCVICLDALREKPAARPPACGHAGHVDCMEKWLERKATCPTCVMPLPHSPRANEYSQPISCCAEHMYYPWTLRLACC